MAEEVKVYEEGDKCPVPECSGLLEYIREDSCSCHISPPCSSCVNAPLECPECGWRPEEVEA